MGCALSVTSVDTGVLCWVLTSGGVAPALPGTQLCGVWMGGSYHMPAMNPAPPQPAWCPRAASGCVVQTGSSEPSWLRGSCSRCRPVPTVPHGRLLPQYAPTAGFSPTAFTSRPPTVGPNPGSVWLQGPSWCRSSWVGPAMLVFGAGSKDQAAPCGTSIPQIPSQLRAGVPGGSHGGSVPGPLHSQEAWMELLLRSYRWGTIRYYSTVALWGMTYSNSVTLIITGAQME